VISAPVISVWDITPGAVISIVRSLILLDKTKPRRRLPGNLARYPVDCGRSRKAEDKESVATYLAILDRHTKGARDV
jgi:ribosome biogenesis protein Tsr3